MKKFPLQFTVNILSLTAVLIFVIWSAHGGLKTEIASLFELHGKTDDTRSKVAHIGDLLFYYAGFVGAVAATLWILHIISRTFPRLTEWLPSFPQILNLLLELVRNLIIFLGIYIYLVQQNGAGLKRQKLLLFPFWYLIAMVLDMVGKTASSLQKVVTLDSAGFYLKVVSFGLMFAQLAGFKPFSLI